MGTTAASRLRDYIGVLLRRKWLVIVAVVVAVGVALALSLASTKIYAASSKVIAEAQSAASTQTSQAVANPTSVATQVEVIRSRPTATEVSTRLGARSPLVSAVRVAAVGKTRVIKITVESSDKVVARDAATTFAQVYVDQRRTAAVDSIQQLGRALLQREQLDKKELDDLDNKIAAGAKGNPADLQGLRTRRDTVAAQYAVDQRRYEQSSIDPGLATNSAQLLQQAVTPNSPVRPRPVRNAVLAVVLGLLVGAAAAFLFEFVDDTMKTPADVERNAMGKRILGTVPEVTDWGDRETARLVSVDSPTAPASAAYRSLRATLELTALQQPLRTLLVTSPTAEEGKTTTVANLAVALANSGRRVICVDCDLRQPRLHQFFGLSPSTGFTSVLLGDQPLSATVRQVSVSGSGSLRLLASGPLPPNPADLLATGRVTELLTAVSADADIVLIDAPPLLPSTDALALSSRVNAVVVVVATDITGRRQLGRAIDLLDDAGAQTIGIVVNGVSGDDATSELLDVVAADASPRVEHV